MILYKFFQKLCVDSIFDGKNRDIKSGCTAFHLSNLDVKKNAERAMLFLHFWSECRDSFAFSQELRKLRIATVQPVAATLIRVAFYLSNLDIIKKAQKEQYSFCAFGPSVEIRTRGLLNPIQARYQTSPHPDFACVSSTA